MIACSKRIGMAREYHDRVEVVILTALERVKEARMALEIKGLGNVVAAARKEIATLRSESAGLGEDVRAMTQSVRDVRKQVNAAHDDLKFEASTLGNAPPDDASSMDNVSQEGLPPSFRSAAE